MYGGYILINRVYNMSVCGSADGSVWVSLQVGTVCQYIIITTAVTRKRRAPAVFAFTLSRNSRQDAIIIICPTSFDNNNIVIVSYRVGAYSPNAFTAPVSSFDLPGAHILLKFRFFENFFLRVPYKY